MWHHTKLPVVTITFMYWVRPRVSDDVINTVYLLDHYRSDATHHARQQTISFVVHETFMAQPRQVRYVD